MSSRRRRIHFAIASLVAACAAMMGDSAFAWGEPGHQVIGSIALQILADHPNAAGQVQQLLGSIDLPLAATWADCARDVHKSGGGFVYRTGQETPSVCGQFSSAETAAMTDYVSRNWNDCTYTATEGCHAAYHFADVAIQRGAYSRADVGTSEHDLVSAIQAAILVLQGQPAPAPFSINSKREALLLLAHFVGDMHQPLHVGAIYLDAQGKAIDPGAMHLALDYCVSGPRIYCTEGANAVLIGASENLHHMWDTIPDAFGVTASGDLVSAAQAIAPSTGSVNGWPGQWASETVAEAGKVAFQNITFSAKVKCAPHAPHCRAGWPGQFGDAEDYKTATVTEQRQQLVRAGARLAQILVAIWPDPPSST